MKIQKLAIAALTGVIFIGAIGASALYWALGSSKSIASLGGGSNQEILGAVSCRARIYMQSAQGGGPELSWTEIWGLTLPGRGFDCTSGSLGGASILAQSPAKTIARRVHASFANGARAAMALMDQVVRSRRLWLDRNTITAIASLPSTRC